MAVFKKGKTWYIDYYVDGQRKRESVGSSRKMAEKVLAKRKVQIAEGRFLDIENKAKISFENLSRQYLEYAKTNKISWSRDALSIKVLSRWFGGKPLFKTTSLAIEKFKSERRQEVTAASVNRELACLKHMFTKAIHWKLASANPVKMVKLFREDNARLRYLTKEEIGLLLNECANHVKPIVLIALFTGMRKSEILNLKWDDLDFKLRLIYVCNTKNGYTKEIPMSAHVFNALKKLPFRSQYIFCNETGNRIAGFRKAFTSAVKRAKIKNFVFHDLRHTFASHLVMNGVDLLTVKELMGHRTISMTLRYAHLSPKHKRNAVESLEYYDGHYLDTKVNIDEAINAVSK